MAGLCTPLPTLRRRPYGQRRTARGRAAISSSYRTCTDHSLPLSRRTAKDSVHYLYCYRIFRNFDWAKRSRRPGSSNDRTSHLLVLPGRPRHADEGGPFGCRSEIPIGGIRSCGPEGPGPAGLGVLDPYAALVSGKGCEYRPISAARIANTTHNISKPRIHKLSRKL
jgi:hypothetical protein